MDWASPQLVTPALRGVDTILLDLSSWPLLNNCSNRNMHFQKNPQVCRQRLSNTSLREGTFPIRKWHPAQRPAPLPQGGEARAKGSHWALCPAISFYQLSATQPALTLASHRVTSGPHGGEYSFPIQIQNFISHLGLMPLITLPFK